MKKRNNFEDTYEDIINKPYKKSNRHPHMSKKDRAAQFAPFSALKGYDEAIRKTKADGEASDKIDFKP